MANDVKMLVIGLGEIGKPIFKILSEVYETQAFDQLDRGFSDPGNSFDVINICFGHKENEVEDFKKWVRDYQKEFLKEGGLTVIHSTVKPGMCKQLNAIHSPVIGQHPFMEEYIRKIPKMFAGKDADKVADYFRRAGLHVLVFDNAEETEWGKLFLTEYYRVCIEFCQRVKRVCDKNGLSFHNVYTLPNMVYNQGYKDMGYPEYVRPILQPIMGLIGGHCVIPNSKIIKTSENAS